MTRIVVVHTQDPSEGRCKHKSLGLAGPVSIAEENLKLTSTFHTLIHMFT